MSLCYCLKLCEKVGEHINVCIAIEECGGLDKIEELQNHQVDQIYNKAFHIVETYFSEAVSIQFYNNNNDDYL